MQRMIGRTLLTLSLLVGTTMSARAADIAGVLPNDSEFVMQLNIKQLLGSKIVKTYASEMVDQFMENSPEAQQFTQLTGLDPRKDLSRIIIAGSGSDPTSATAVILLEGTYDVVKLNTVLAEVARAKSEMISVVKDGNLTMYKIEGPDSPVAMYATVADKSLVVMATSKELVKDTIAKKNGTKKGNVSKDLATLLDRVKDESSMYMVAVTKDKTKGLPIPQPEVADIVEKIHGISMSLNVNADIALDINVGVEDEDIAKELGGKLAELIPQAKLAIGFVTNSQPKLAKPLKDIVNTLKSGVSGKVITLKISVPATAVDSLIKFAKERGMP